MIDYLKIAQQLALDPAKGTSQLDPYGQITVWAAALNLTENQAAFASSPEFITYAVRFSPLFLDPETKAKANQALEIGREIAKKEPTK